MAGSSGPENRSLRFQRTCSAPVVVTAWATRSGYPLSQLAHPRRLGPPPRVGALVDGIGDLFEQPLRRLVPPPDEWGLLVFQRRLRRSAAASQPPLQAFI